MGIIDELSSYPPRYGPEWGSGGIFGLKYNRGVLYYTVAFEAEAYFISEDSERVYGFEHVGPEPTSGGDTYNASEVVDEFIYFGGWVHAPAVYEGKRDGKSTIAFYNKYSHVHVYDVDNDEVRLLWKETIGKRDQWAGEVSNIIYDPIGDRLLLSRLDGHENLGVYSLSRDGKELQRVSDVPSLKGVLVKEYACFDSSTPYLGIFPESGLRGIQTLDLVTNKLESYPIKDYSAISKDGFGVFAPITGTMCSAYGRIFTFVRGGLVISDIFSEEHLFIRLFDFMSGYAPQRTVALPLGGGVLVAYNAYTHGILRPFSDEEAYMRGRLDRVVGPTVLLYITPPTVRIVGAFGARITSMERVGEHLLLGTCTMANLGALNASPVDAGYKEILPVRIDSILGSRGTPVEFNVPGSFILDLPFGGIPLYGYKYPRIIIRCSKENELEIYEYTASLDKEEPERDNIDLREGRNVIELSSYRGILSFRLTKPDEKARIRISLE